MDILGGLQAAGSILSTAKSLFGGGDDGPSERDSLLAQYQYSAMHERNRPTWQVYGLRKAGLNPMLAVSKGIQSGGMPTISPGSERQQDTAKAQLGLNSALAAAQISNQASQAELYKAQADNVRAQTTSELKRPDLIEADIGFRKAQTATEAWGPENKKWATELLSAQFGKTVSERQAIEMWQRALTEAQTKVSTETYNHLVQLVSQAKTKAQLDAAYSEIERIVGIGSDVVSSAKSLLPKITPRSGPSISKGQRQ